MKNEEVESPRNWTCDKEGDSEDCIEILKKVSSEMENLWHELSLLENRLASQRMNILNVQLKLDKGEAGMSFAKEESILELKKAKLTTRISQGGEGQSLRFVKEEEERYVGIDEQHSDEVFERNKVESELLNCLLEASEYDVLIKDNEQRLIGDEMKYLRKDLILLKDRIAS